MTNETSLLKGHTPRQILVLARQCISASWSLRRATSIGEYNRLVGRLRVVNRGQLIVGHKVFFHAEFANSVLVVQEGAELLIGDRTYINYGADICAHKRIEIGQQCNIGTHCIIMDSDFHHVELERRNQRPPAEEVIIEPEVWIGNRVTILKGVRIGYGSVVAAGSVVTKSIPPMSIAAGVPAKVLRPITEGRHMQMPIADLATINYRPDVLVRT